MISINYSSSTSSWKPVRLGLILSMRDIYINSNLNLLRKLTGSSRSTEFIDILPWSISQVITKAVPISTRIFISHALKQCIPIWVWRKVNGNWVNHIIRTSQWKGSCCRINTRARRKNWIPKSRTVRKTLRDLFIKLNYLSRSFQTERI